MTRTGFSRRCSKVESRRVARRQICEGEEDADDADRVERDLAAAPPRQGAELAAQPDQAGHARQRAGGGQRQRRCEGLQHDEVHHTGRRQQAHAADDEQSRSERAIHVSGAIEGSRR
jgi:hypothetical protein